MHGLVLFKRLDWEGDPAAKLVLDPGRDGYILRPTTEQATAAKNHHLLRLAVPEPQLSSQARVSTE